MTGESILVVDDTLVNLKLLMAILNASGYRVHTATSADEALVILKNERLRLVLMDIQLPGVDGLTFTESLRRDPAFEDLIIIAVTSFAMKGDREKALAAGCDDYLSKPIDTRALPGFIADHLAAGRRRS